MNPVKISHKPLRHGYYHVYVNDALTGETLDVRVSVAGKDLRKTVEKLSESYDDVRTQPVPQDTRTWS